MKILNRFGKITIYKKNNMKLFLFFAALIFLVSCSPYKKLDRLLIKYPELLHESSDTIYKDSVIFLKDTILLKGSNVNDSFIIRDLNRKQFFKVENDQVITLVTYQPNTDGLNQISINSEVKPDSIYIDRPVEIKVPEIRNRELIVTKPIYFIKWYDWALRIIFILGFFGLCYFIFRNLKQYFDKGTSGNGTKGK